MKHSEQEWKEKLSPECYTVCRGKGTERPFANKYWDCRGKGTERPFANKYWDYHDKGTYLCAACGAPLFRSEDKFDSGSGWPSFTKPVKKEHVLEVSDSSHGMIRTEVLCNACDSHLYPFQFNGTQENRM